MNTFHSSLSRLVHIFGVRPSVLRLLPSALCLSLLLSACRPAQPVPLRVQWLTMGTFAAVQCADHATAPQARDIAQAVFDGLDADLSVWKPESPISAVNRAAGTPAALPASPAFAAVLRAALDTAALSDGAFNPLIGPVMRAWGFNGADARPAPPEPAELAAALALADWRSVAFTPSPTGATVRLPVAGMRLDLGAAAKGYAVDLAWERLTSAGYTNLLVDLGGNLRALGEAAPGRGGWRTGVRNPFSGDSAILASFLLRSGEAVATSGNYERFIEINGVRYAHIMDGRTATPVTGMAGVTVTAPDALTADILSTTLFILGPQKGIALLRQHPGCEVAWIPDTPDRPTVLATPGLAARLIPIGPCERSTPGAPLSTFRFTVPR